MVESTHTGYIYPKSDVHFSPGEYTPVLVLPMPTLKAARARMRFENDKLAKLTEAMRGEITVGLFTYSMKDNPKLVEAYARHLLRVIEGESK